MGRIPWSESAGWTLPGWSREEPWLGKAQWGGTVTQGVSLLPGHILCLLVSSQSCECCQHPEFL